MGKATKAIINIGGAPLNEELKKVMRDWHKDPGENRPCKTCKKPTRSHWDPHAETMQCHVCFVKKEEEGLEKIWGDEEE